jgi:Xaa-Pro aminopeptidase
MVTHRYNIKRFLDFPSSEYEARYAKLKLLMAPRGIDALLVTTEQNVRYFTGLKTVLFRTRLRPITALLPVSNAHEPAMIVPEVLEATCLATTWVEDIRINSECYGKPSTSVIEVLLDTMKDLGLSMGTIGMEFGMGHHLGLTYEEFGTLQSRVPQVQWVNASDLIWELRAIKSALEVEALKTAGDISAAGIEAGFQALKPGLLESELYSVITSTYYREGAEDHLLNLMSGAKGNQVRDALAADLPFEKGHFMKVDGGAVYKGYACDFCRILGVGRLLDSQRRAIATSALANAGAIAAMRPGVPIRELAAAADRVLSEAGFGFYMNAIGHAIGLDVHERPWLDRNVSTPIKQGMVFAVEVGVVDPDRFDDGSYTFEENVVVTEDGARVLTDRLPAVLLETS